MNVAIASAIAILGAWPSAIGEAWVCSSAINGMSRNPEMFKSLRSTMVFAVALVETTAIYSLLVSLLILFIA